MSIFAIVHSIDPSWRQVPQRGPQRSLAVDSVPWIIICRRYALAHGALRAWVVIEHAALLGLLNLLLDVGILIYIGQWIGDRIVYLYLLCDGVAQRGVESCFLLQCDIIDCVVAQIDLSWHLQAALDEGLRLLALARVPLIASHATGYRGALVQYQSIFADSHVVVDVLANGPRALKRLHSRCASPYLPISFQ